MLDSKAIETLSVNAVRNSIVICPILDQFIPDNDKEPSWDGNVYIYNSSSKTKDNLKGRLPVQVKGTENNDFLKEKITLISSVFHGLSIHPKTKTLPLHHPVKKSSDDGISSWIPRPRSHP